MPNRVTLTASPLELPVLPLRDVVMFPHMVVPLFVGRAKSIRALEIAMQSDRKVVLVAQKTASKDEPTYEDMFATGCIATILQLLKLPDGTVKVLVEGLQRAQINQINQGQGDEFFTAVVTPASPRAEEGSASASPRLEALRRALLDQFERFIKLHRKIPESILNSITSLDDAGRMTDTIAAHVP